VRKRFLDLSLNALLLSQGLCAAWFLALCSMLLAPCSSAHAQQPKKIPRVGILSPRSSGGSSDIDAFGQGLRALGYVEGQNIAFEYRWAEGNEDRLPALAAELLHIDVDLIVATNPRAARAAQRLTSTTPIVTPVIPSAVGSGLVDSLYRPGRNVTGLSYMASELDGKRLELLKEIIPKISRVAVLANVGNVDRETKKIALVARSLSVQLQLLNVKKPDEIESAVASMAREKVDALIVLTQGMFTRNATKDS
jgi:ABC-type uncharacterized transport system substrate-binding protein